MSGEIFSPDEAFRLSAHLGHGEPARVVSELFAGDRPVYIYGAGFAGKECLERLSSMLPGGAGRIAAFLDKDPARCGGKFAGVRVLAPEDPEIAASRPVVVLASYHRSFLEAMAGNCRRLRYDCVHAGLLYFLGDRADGVREAATVWADEKSKETYRRAVRAVLTRDDADLTALAEGDQYFPPFMPKEFYRSFVDGGAYFGDTLKQYRLRLEDRFDHYYAFEPDKRNFDRLKEQAGGDARIRLYHKALLDREGELPFQQCEHAGGSYVGGGADAVGCTAVDVQLAGSPATFIKMDIEGAEPQALRGAEKTIRTQTPALGISVYHHPDHLWLIPLWIKRTNPGYRLYLRHHSPVNWCETVCYAVSGERVLRAERTKIGAARDAGK